MAFTKLNGIAPEELREEVYGMLHQSSPSPYHSDYDCAFCGERPPTNDGDITHRDDCFGIRLLNSIQITS